MGNQIRWGFLGCGKVVQKKSGDAFRAVPHSTIHAIMRRDISAAEAAARHFGADSFCDTQERLLAADIDAVYIATPPGLHYDQAMACLAAGKPVYLEKPFARNYSEARALTQAFQSAGIPLYVGHYRRALPRFLKIRQLLLDGVIGPVRSVDFYLNRVFDPAEASKGWIYTPRLSGGGKFFDIAPHTVDIFQFLFGDIRAVSGSAVNTGTGCPLENLVTMDVLTERNIRGHLRFCCTASEKSDRMTVTGSAGIMEFSVHGKQDIKVWSPEGRLTHDLTIPDPVTVEQPMVQTVVEDLLGLGPCLSHAEDVLSTYRVIDLVLEDYYGGRQDDFWNHPERYGNRPEAAATCVKL